MEFGAMLEALELGRGDELAQALCRRIEADPGHSGVPVDWRRLAAAIARRMTDRPGDSPAPLPCWASAGPGLVLGVSGAQGSGKSTLARALGYTLGAAGARTLVLSLDDFYLTRRERQVLAAEVHPLFRTRGVPGTHDVDLLTGVLAELGSEREVAVPVFDKGLDDRLPVAAWRRVRGPVDVVVLEGWCLGARPQPEADLGVPVNALEAHDDPHGIWRRYANAALVGPYAQLWETLQALVFLRVPGMDAVLRWRALQELGLPPERRMSDAALARFVAHYERITRATLQALPPQAALIVDLADDHRIAGLTLRQRR